MKKASLGILFVAVSLFGATSAFADGIAGSCPCDMGFDENGNGFVNAEPEAGILAPDPGPGGLAAVLTYALPFAGVAGDVGLTAAEGTFDYLRFNGNGTLVFYSDNTDGTDAIGDTASPPASFYANLILIPEVGSEGENGIIYVPTAGQPGFNSGGDQYVIVSDGVLAVPPIPEPSTFTLFGSGILTMAGYGLRRLKKGARDRKGEGESTGLKTRRYKERDEGESTGLKTRHYKEASSRKRLARRTIRAGSSSFASSTRPCLAPPPRRCPRRFTAQPSRRVRSPLPSAGTPASG